MGVLSSGLYLISSLGAADAGLDADHAVATVPAGIVAPDVANRAATASVAPTVFDLPASARAGGKTLDDAIAEEVRRDSVTDRSAGVLAAAALTESDVDAGGGLEQAVIATHDSRIALLRERIAAVTGDGAGARQVEALRLRLHRAQAARRLAIARAHLDGAMTACAPGACQPSLATSGAGRERERGTRSSSAPDRTAIGQTGIRVASARKQPTSAPSLALSGPAAAATGGEAARRLTAHDRAVADLSSHARHLLATARRLLETDKTEHPAITLTGLLHWEGSNSWSLSEGPKTA